MTKKHVFVCFLLLSMALSLSGEALEVDAEALPSGVDLSWSPVSGASFYDIYADGRPVARLGADGIGYEVTGLESYRQYSICVAARDDDNKDIEAEWVDVVTEGWDGVYRWVNETGNDNGGKMREKTLRVETGRDPVYGQFFNLFLVGDDGSEVRIFPLYPLGSGEAGCWEDYNGDSTAAIAYRVNADALNTSPFKPSRWRLDRIVIDYDSTSAYIQTSALGLTVDIEIVCRFFMEDGVQKLSFDTRASGIADTVLFKNPNPDEGDAFIFSKI